MDLLNINNGSAEREKFDRKTFSVSIGKAKQFGKCMIDKAKQWDMLRIYTDLIYFDMAKTCTNKFIILFQSHVLPQCSDFYFTLLNL